MTKTRPRPRGAKTTTAVEGDADLNPAPARAGEDLYKLRKLNIKLSPPPPARGKTDIGNGTARLRKVGTPPAGADPKTTLPGAWENRPEIVSLGAVLIYGIRFSRQVYALSQFFAGLLLSTVVCCYSQSGRQHF